MLRTRVITALLLMALTLPAMIFDPPIWWAILSLAFLALAAHEWQRLQPVRSGRSVNLFAPLIVLLGSSWLLAMRWWPVPADEAGVAVMVLAAIFWMIGAPWRLRSLPLSAGPAWLVMLLLLACWFALVDLREIGPVALFCGMAIVWVADIGAYFVGKRFGRRKLAPAISPGKSWEGVFGGIFFVVIIALSAAASPVLADAIPARLVERVGPILAALLLAALSLLSVVGDLYESALKRAAGVKDSGKTLPGHGGVLDRVDGLIPVMPCVALLHRLLS